MKERPSYYAIIPARVRYSDLKPNAKLLYGEITALSGKLGYCFATNSYFADLYGVSKNTISSWIGDLNKAEFITVKIERNKQKQIIKRCIGITEKMDTPLHKKKKGNTTSNNTTSNNNIYKLKQEVNNFDTTEDHKKDFLEYWLETSRSGKTKYEMQKTWNTNRRLKTWISNYNNWYEKSDISKIDNQLNEYLKGKELL
tara:strand:- start:18812 stop:19408 length:597 start_codon:yes stop_codon:yes gene_type:complete